MLSSDVSMGTMTEINPGSEFREHELSLHASMVDMNSVSVDDVPDKQQTLYVYVVEIILYVQRYIVPPTVDELLVERVHVV